MNGVEQAGALALVGPGRAGTTIAAALGPGLAGRRGGRTQPGVAEHLAAAPSIGRAGGVGRGRGERDADLVIVATPDAAIDESPPRSRPRCVPDALVIHLSGARGLDALAAVPGRVGALHPLQTIPTIEAGLARLPGSWCAIAGDPQVAVLAAQLRAAPVEVDDRDRARYHAAACIASNHLVALLDQVARVAPIPLEAFLPLVRATVENVAALGPAAALTGSGRARRRRDRARTPRRWRRTSGTRTGRSPVAQQLAGRHRSPSSAVLR